MDLIGDLGAGFAAVLDPILLLTLVLGVLIGTLVGVLPGIGPVGAMAILFPLTFSLDPAAGLIMTAGIYIGSQYGGSTSAILIGVPGEASSVVSTIDGYQLSKRGRAGAALAVAAIGSFIAGTIAVLLLMLISGPLSQFAAEFASPEYLMLALFALLVLSRLAGGSISTTFAAVGLGLMLATIGLDSGSGTVRFTFDSRELVQGVNVTALAVGLFGLAEVLLLAEGVDRGAALPKVPFRSLRPNRREMRLAAPAMVRGGVLGFLFGLIPGPSAVVSTYASYLLEKRIAKRPEEFGKGAIQGVAGPESANNGAAGGVMVPLLILGLPFNAPTALLLAGFTIHGIIPGPLFIENNPALFWTVIAGLYAANFVLLIFNLPLVGMFTKLLRVPRDLLLASVVLIAIIGTFAARGQLVDVVWLLVAGILGYFMVKLNVSRVALMLAFVIGPLFESSLKQTIVLSGGDPLYLASRPIAMTVIIFTALIMIAPPVLRRMINRDDSKLPVTQDVDA